MAGIKHALLFSPLTMRGVTLRNRIAVSPMCQYSSNDGMANDWHLVHLGSRAVGGAGLVIAEATAVSPEGRISPSDLGIWSDEHVSPLRRVTSFIKEQGAVAGLQIAHAGRKASTAVPWERGGQLSPDEGGWATVAPSALPFRPEESPPRSLTPNEIKGVAASFAAAARRALAAGFEVLEVHAAHGYLLHEFLSPLTNQRQDEYGGSLQNRMRAPLEVVAAVREAWPDEYPLFVRISATDWADGGWDLTQSIALAKALGETGVDLIDVSSGGAVPGVRIPTTPGYQVRFAADIKPAAGISTGAVGLITEADQAEDVLAREQADLILLGRAILRDPYWPLKAAKSLGVGLSYWPTQYRSVRPASD